MALGISTLPASESSRGLIEQLLDEQQLLTPVADFARKHARGEVGTGTGNYRELLPVTPLMRGEQYAFEVDLDKCSGCKACVTACHSLNGLDDNETWREVGLLISAPSRSAERGVRSAESRVAASHSAFRIPHSAFQHVTTACHHCVDPACLNGCPVLAYEKDPITGIVRHLDDQCIGCQYCVLKCPYDVPKYNARLGIVRKCDMCANRLAVGEAPACAQACPNEAIRITKVQTETVRIEFRERSGDFLPGAPAGDYTLPTTRYVLSHDADRSADRRVRESAEPPEHADSAVRAPELIAADAMTLRPQPAHWPLVLMLVLSQAAVGVTCAGLFAPGDFALRALALALGIASIVASVFHLGRPMGAWRFFLGLRRSWLSREILMFSVFVPLLALALLFVMGTPVSDPARLSNLIRAASETGAPIAGVLGVFCSMMIYHDTRRALWHWGRSAPLFFGSAALLGLSALFAAQPFNGITLGTLVAAITIKLAVEIAVLRHVTDRELTPLKKTALLISGKFQSFAFTRGACLIVGGIGLPLLLHANAFETSAGVAAWFAFTLLVVGEILERMLFFRAVVAPKMPGGLPA